MGKFANLKTVETCSRDELWEQRNLFGFEIEGLRKYGFHSFSEPNNLELQRKSKLLYDRFFLITDKLDGKDPCPKTRECSALGNEY